VRRRGGVPLSSHRASSCDRIRLRLRGFYISARALRSTSHCAPLPAWIGKLRTRPQAVHCALRPPCSAWEIPRTGNDSNNATLHRAMQNKLCISAGNQ
jgi:hypothetical protein